MKSTGKINPAVEQGLKDFVVADLKLSDDEAPDYLKGSKADVRARGLWLCRSGACSLLNF